VTVAVVATAATGLAVAAPATWAQAPAAGSTGTGLIGRSTATTVRTTVLGSADAVPADQASRLARVAGAPVTRLAGRDRYATAVAVSKSVAPSGTTEVVLATGSSFPDALAAGPLAARLSGVLLITGSGALPSVVASELGRLRPSRITVIGGVGAVSAGVAAQARTAAGGGKVTVRRLEGRDRYATAAAVSRQFPVGVGAVLASGADFPDGVASGPVASVLRGPVLLTRPTELSAATRSELARLDPRRLVIAGGAGAVSLTTESAAESAAGRTAERAGGSDRYATSASLAAVLARTVPPRGAFVATGLAFPDALVGGVAAAAQDAPVLLTSNRRAGRSVVAAEVARLRGVGPWVQLSLDALARQQGLGGTHTAYDAAYQLMALAALYGWADPEVRTQLTRLRAVRKPDGGYGIDVAWDAFGDGSVNPASTSYLITVTDHAGRALLQAHQAGLVGDGEIAALVDLVLRWASLTGDRDCLAYSSRASDRAICIYNVNTSAAWFLAAAHAQGVQRPGQLETSERLYGHDAPLQTAGWWPYGSNAPNRRQDMNHNASMIDMQLLLDPAAGQASLDAVMPGGWRHPDVALRRFDDAMGYTRLLPHACGYRSTDVLNADRQLVAAQREASDVGQVTLWAAATAAACGP
jgi:putative cell wall-binding protein